jgi:putative transposase
VAELCRAHGMSNASFYKWRAKYGGMDASLISQMKAVEDENRRLKRMYADLSMRADLLKESLGKKCRRHLNAARWPRMRCATQRPHCAGLPRVLSDKCEPVSVCPTQVGHQAARRPRHSARAATRLAL